MDAQALDQMLAEQLGAEENGEGDQGEGAEAVAQDNAAVEATYPQAGALETNLLQHIMACCVANADRLSLKPWLLAKFDPASASAAGEVLFTHQLSCGSTVMFEALPTQSDGVLRHVTPTPGSFVCWRQKVVAAASCGVAESICASACRAVPASPLHLCDALAVRVACMLRARPAVLDAAVADLPATILELRALTVVLQDIEPVNVRGVHSLEASVAFMEQKSGTLAAAFQQQHQRQQEQQQAKRSRVETGAVAAASRQRAAAAAATSAAARVLATCEQPDALIHIVSFLPPWEWLYLALVSRAVRAAYMIACHQVPWLNGSSRRSQAPRSCPTLGWTRPWRRAWTQHG
jgi:hypothetical protein